jgi:predicted nucleic acid-binding protein
VWLAKRGCWCEASEEKDQAISVQDLVVGEAIEILTNPNEVVVKLLPLREVVIEEIVPEEVEAAEVEVITAAEELAEVEEEAEPPTEEQAEGEGE